MSHFVGSLCATVSYRAQPPRPGRFFNTISDRIGNRNYSWVLRSTEPKMGTGKICWESEGSRRTVDNISYRSMQIRVMCENGPYLSLYFHFSLTLPSLPLHFTFTSLSLFIHITFTLLSFYFHFSFTLLSLYFHFIFTFHSPYFHFFIPHWERRRR